MRLVGLTGGIASGKSTVSHHLESQGLPVVDGDKVARVALDKNTWGWTRVVATFGEGLVREDGEVDRAKLGEIIFNDPAKRGMLNRAIEQARVRINSQLPLDKKREQAGYVIDNSGTLEDTMMQVDKVKNIITGPPTWRELALSRFGVPAIVVATVALMLQRLR